MGQTHTGAPLWIRDRVSGFCTSRARSLFGPEGPKIRTFLLFSVVAGVRGYGAWRKLYLTLLCGQIRALERFCLLNPCFILALLAALGTALFHESQRPRIHLRTDRVVEVEGWICQQPQVLDTYIYAELSPLRINQGHNLPYPGRLALYISSSSTDPGSFFDPPLAYGEVLNLTTFLRDPSYYAVPGVPDLRQSFWDRGIMHVVYVKSPLLVGRQGYHSWASLLRPLFWYSDRFKIFCSQLFKPDHFKLFSSILLGHNRLLDEKQVNQLKNLGILHLFVVSGFHISLVAFALHRLLKPAGFAGQLLTLAGSWAYVLVAGSGLSALRAGLMVTTFYVLLTFGLYRQFLNVVGISALVLLALWPGALRTAGFQFSYLALCSIGLFVLPRQRLLQALGLSFRRAFSDSVVVGSCPHWRRHRRFRFLLEEKFHFWPRKCTRRLLPILGRTSVALTGLTLAICSIQLLSLPINLYYSNRWVWTQWVSNLVLVPAFSPFIPLGFLLFLTFWLPVGPAIAEVVTLYADLLLMLMKLLESFSCVTYVRQPQVHELAAYSCFLLCFLFPRRWKFLVLLGPLLLWLAVRQPAAHPSGRLVITMLDVGQGECMHIRYPDGTDALVDTGGFFSPRRTRSQFVGERLVSRYLWEEQVRRLEFVLLTHPDIDHVQGFTFVQRAFSIGRLFFHHLQPGYPQGPRVKLQAGDSFLVAGVEHFVLHPPDQSKARRRWSTNDASLVMELRYKNFRMLFTGDIGRLAEGHLSSRLEAVTVLKAAHHGARTSNTRELIERTQPQLAMISAGRRNIFGHPAPAVLDRFAQAGVPVLTTAQNGSIRVQTDGHTWRVFGYSVQDQQFQEVPLR